MQKETVEKPEDVEIDEQELDLADYPLDDILIRTSQLRTFNRGLTQLTVMG